MISCPRCGRELLPGMRFCDGCGAPVLHTPPRPSRLMPERAKPAGRGVALPWLRVSRRMAIAGGVILFLLIIGAVAASRPQPSVVTKYVTITETERSTMTQLETITVTQTLQTGASPALVEYCFSPGGNCASVLIKWITRANSSIHILIYSFTLDNVRDALIQAKNRGVEVKIVFDEQQAHGQGSEYSNLRAAGVDVRIDTGAGLMHDKVAIIDGHIIITGSFNWSQAGNQENNENLIVLEDASWAAAYEQQFQLIYNAASVSMITGVFTTMTSTGTRTTQSITSGTPGASCASSYPTVCIPPPPPDLDCNQIPYRNFPVLPPDPHRFDGDKDGIGCET